MNNDSICLFLSGLLMLCVIPLVIEGIRAIIDGIQEIIIWIRK